MQIDANTTGLGKARFTGYLQKLGGLCSPWLDLALPPQCTACGGLLPHTVNRAFANCLLCATCRQFLAPQAVSRCRRCAAPVSESEADQDACRRCRGVKFRFQQVTALGVYEGRLREVVLRMKRPPGELLSLAMGELLAERLRERVSQEPVDWVAAMPMHWRRRWVRTVNPPELLAERVSRRLGLTTRRVLYFRRNIQQQSTLAPSLRQRNVRGALGVFPGYDLADARVLLLDDILTTGATANEAARCLKRAGAKSVQVAVVARGVGID